jgi:hypothetical protein
VANCINSAMYPVQASGTHAMTHPVVVDSRSAELTN